MADDLRNRGLRVADFIATTRNDPERGPAVALNEREARSRLLTEGELAWVYGPRRGELATVHIDPDVRDGDVIVRVFRDDGVYDQALAEARRRAQRDVLPVEQQVVHARLHAVEHLIGIEPEGTVHLEREPVAQAERDVGEVRE